MISQFPTHEKAHLKLEFESFVSHPGDVFVVRVPVEYLVRVLWDVQVHGLERLGVGLKFKKIDFLDALRFFTTITFFASMATHRVTFGMFLNSKRSLSF